MDNSETRKSILDNWKVMRENELWNQFISSHLERAVEIIWTLKRFCPIGKNRDSEVLQIWALILDLPINNLSVNNILSFLSFNILIYEMGIKWD